MSDDYSLVPSDDFGDLQPYQPDTPLIPQDNEWLVPAPDFIDDHQSFSNTAPVQIFGAEFPGTVQEAQRGINQLADAFIADAARMRLDPALVNVAVSWLKSNALLPMGHVERRHHYDLAGYSIPNSDRDAVTSFLNFMYKHGAPQRFAATCLWWINEIGKQQSQPQQQYPSQDDLTESEWKIVEARCESDKAACDAALRNYWGNQYKINMSIVKEYMATLPVQEREYLEMTVCKGGILSGNSPEVIVSIYKAAIGTMPRNGDVSAEIAAIEKVMRENRKAYLADSRMQARLRELYDLRGY